MSPASGETYRLHIAALYRPSGDQRAELARELLCPRRRPAQATQRRHLLAGDLLHDPGDTTTNVDRLDAPQHELIDRYRCQSDLDQLEARRRELAVLARADGQAPAA